MRILFMALAAALGMFAHASAEAAVTPLAVAVVPPIQFPPSDFTIAGARVSALWGKHRNVYGLDIGVLGNITYQNFTGIGISGLFNMTEGQTTITLLQAAGLANWNRNKTDAVGLQLALGANVNMAESSILGFQLAGISNFSPHTKVMGGQIGIYNRARNVYGFQIGLVNVADSLKGIQIGLINFNKTGMFYVAPIINVGF